MNVENHRDLNTSVTLHLTSWCPLLRHLCWNLHGLVTTLSTPGRFHSCRMRNLCVAVLYYSDSRHNQRAGGTPNSSDSLLVGFEVF